MKPNSFIYIWLMTLILLAASLILVNKEVRTAVLQPLDIVQDLIEPDSSGKLEESQSLGQVEGSNPVSNFSSEQPLVYTLPNPGEPPVSYWRPPLYETPWAASPFDHFYFSRPIAADEVNWPLANYRYGYFFPGTDIVHTGIDIDAPRGTPVIAAAPGKVIWVGYGLYYGNNNPDDPYGLAVTIEHDFGYNGNKLITVYAHMDRIDVEFGQEVHTGTQLGIVGNTGFTTGPHLHFEVRLATNSFFRTRNPELWLAPPQGWGVLAGQLRKRDYTMITYQEVYVRNKETNQVWMVRTYGPSSVNNDDYYQENLVLSDLPAGSYSLNFTYRDVNYRYDFSIHPGNITYFTFQENIGFSDHLPELKLPENWENIVLSDDFPGDFD